VKHVDDIKFICFQKVREMLDEEFRLRHFTKEDKKEFFRMLAEDFGF
jgi:hypothetical protein